MPTTPADDPAIAATSATSGTLRYSAFSPVIDVIESAKTTFSVSKNATGNSSAWTIAKGLRTHRMSSRRASTKVCDRRWGSEFSEWASASTAAPTRTTIRISAGKPR